MTDNNTRGIPTQESLDAQLKKMKETFILNALRAWKVNRSHPIMKKYPKQKTGTVVWNSKERGTYKRVYEQLTAQEILLSKELKQRELNEKILKHA